MISVTNSDKGSFTMKFSTRDRYALRLMVELANRPNDLIPLKAVSYTHLTLPTNSRV